MEKAWLSGAQRAGDAGVSGSEDAPEDEDRGNVHETGADPSPHETGPPELSTAGEDISLTEPVEENLDASTGDEEIPREREHRGGTQSSVVYTSRHGFVDLTPTRAPVIQIVHAAYESMLVSKHPEQFQWF